MGEQPVGGAIIPYSAFTPASLAVKNPLAIQETWVQSLYRDDPLEKEMATHSQYSCLGNLIDRGAWRSMGSPRVGPD